ncbi:MAG: hypothetical protein HY535_00455 [Chloroflexi bacterium]|nr:hypothetical protein [Chloroflexota bacterium]
MRTIILLALTLAFILACTSPAEETPTPTATPTPTPTPAYFPTYADFDLVARQKSRYSLHESYAPFAALYVARECFAGNPLTLDGFRAFAYETLFTEYEIVLESEVVGKMFALGGKDVRGSCIELYLYPKTGAEASLGLELVANPRRIHPIFREASKSRYQEMVARWFQQEAQSREPFVPWLWKRDGLDLRIQIPSDVPVPRGDTQLPPTWALEYQLGIQEARIRELEASKSP